MRYKFRCLHGSQKPLKFIDLIVRCSTDSGDVVWEPFGGLCPGAIVCHAIGRRYRAAEIVSEFFLAAKERLSAYDKQGITCSAKKSRSSDMAAL
jgi:site-specific DNA-methyltransferase (adenine-specific)